MKAKEIDTDIVDLLRANGYRVVEGKDAVLEKIDEMAKNKRK